jgi:hypothetical protein
LLDFSLILLSVLLVTTLAAAFEYYRQIRTNKREYERAKGAVEDIIMSINRELKRENMKLDTIEFKLAGSVGRAETASKKVDALERVITPIETQINTVSNANIEILAKINEVDKRMTEMESTNEELKKRFSIFEDQVQKFSTAPETGVEPVIQIRRDKAMGALTNTEIAVLEMLSAEGPKTAPEIKERVHLSREHTSRLMKKLYEGGYLERETGKIPFNYSVKKEMEKLLNKPANETA